MLLTVHWNTSACIVELIVVLIWTFLLGGMLMLFPEKPLKKIHKFHM